MKRVAPWRQNPSASRTRSAGTFRSVILLPTPTSITCSPSPLSTNSIRRSSRPPCRSAASCATTHGLCAARAATLSCATGSTAVRRSSFCPGPSGWNSASCLLACWGGTRPKRRDFFRRSPSCGRTIASRKSATRRSTTTDPAWPSAATTTRCAFSFRTFPASSTSITRRGWKRGRCLANWRPSVARRARPRSSRKGTRCCWRCAGKVCATSCAATTG